MTLRDFLYKGRQRLTLIKLIDNDQNITLAEDYLKKIIEFHPEYLDNEVYGWEIDDNHSITLWI